LDCKNHTRYTGYHITSYNGLLYSFEREFFDMVRSTMLKYNLQARIGQMAGIMVAYHNTCKIFGFEYVPQSAMDEQLFGSTIVGKMVFNIATKLLDFALNGLFADSSTNSAAQIRLTAHVPKGMKHIDFFVEHLPESAYHDHPDSVVRHHYAPFGVDLLNMTELRQRLKDLEMDDKGTRPSLVARLESALHAPVEADIPSVSFFENLLETGVVRHYRLHLFLAQKDVMVESLHEMKFTHLEVEEPQTFADLNAVQVRYELEPLFNEIPISISAKKYHSVIRDSIEENDEVERAKVAAEIPLNG